MTWFYVVSMALTISLAANIFLAWYCIRLLDELFFVSETLENLFLDIETFKEHLARVYEMQMFYGDQTLENLLSHARALSKEFNRYETLFLLREPLEDDNIDEEADTDAP